MGPRDRLQELFTEFPGIGPRQARRFVYFLLSRGNGYLEELVNLILETKKANAVCESCFRFYAKSGKGAPCSLCADPSRERKTLLVVERDVDLETIERSRTYRGLYFVLGGAIPILEKEPEKRARLRELKKILESRAGELAEVILALSVTPEGEHTADYLKEFFKAIPAAQRVRISILGRGLSTGSEIEYTDPETIKQALGNRR